MSTDEIIGQRKDHPKSLKPSNQHGIKKFHHLSYELLKFSAQVLLRKDFLPKVSEKIREDSGCDEVEIWVKEEYDKHYRCVVTPSKQMPFGFILVPCPLGEETDTPSEDPNKLSMEKLCCQVIKGSVDGLFPYVTERGSFWIAGIDETMAPDNFAKIPPPSPTLDLPCSYQSFALIPIRLDEECIGLLQLKSRKGSFFSRHDIVFYEDISTVLGVVLSHQYTQIELRERIKEITCLYGIARVMAKQGATFDEIIQNIVNLLPPAWLYPEITCARIVLNGKTYHTESFRSSPYRQLSDILVSREKVGYVEVVYLEKRLTLDEGPFMFEERSLIDSVAREVAIFYERIKTEKEKSLLQEQLRHADRLATIGQLAAGVAHELNEPLGNILGFTQLAQKSPELPAQIEKDLSRIESASLKAREIIRKLLTFARQLPPEKKPVNLNNIVTECIAFFEARCIEQDVQLVYRLTPDLPMITVDPGQTNQVLVNLMVNAIQAMPEGGTLTVETRLTDEKICLSVEDTGIGMSEKMAQQIFLPFFTTKDVNEGTGLGLAMVHGIVTSHGGRIQVKSELEKGTLFLVQLPMTTASKFDESET